MKAPVSRRVLARTIAEKLLAEPSRRGHWLQALAAFIVEYKMENDVDLLVNDIAHEVFEQNGQLLVDVTSARPLGADIRSELTNYLKQALGARTVTMTEQTDPSLVGGLVARTPDHELDTSVRTKLQQLATIK